MKKIYFHISFDVPNSYEDFPKSMWEISRSLAYCLDFLQEIGCNNATWFVDEYRCKLTEKLPKELLKLTEYGELGLHSHLNYPPYADRNHIPRKYGIIFSQIKTGKERLEEFLREHTNQKGVIGIRSGGFLTNKVYFKVIRDLGFEVDSSIVAFYSIRTMTIKGFIMRYMLRKIGIKYDDINFLPVGAQPYYTRWDTFLRATKYGDVLEIPTNVFTRMLEKGFDIKDLVYQQLNRNRIRNSVVINICIHPFEFAKFNILSRFFTSFVNEHYAKYVTVNKVRELVKEII